MAVPVLPASSVHLNLCPVMELAHGVDQVWLRRQLDQSMLQRVFARMVSANRVVAVLCVILGLIGQCNRDRQHVFSVRLAERH